ncbi:vWA domain-containing protein [Flexithrix dorotheae]|uniref:vWA domain-containing protein n=1 Tax=Flexithrix dorotheae TaxID=70993 RepID=UPI00036CEB3B|nr:von Willebrand factor type A domain-containing protein [Flexithrix dorotheae]
MRNSVLKITIISLALLMANACSKNSQIAKEEPATEDLSPTVSGNNPSLKTRKLFEKKDMNAQDFYYSIQSGDHIEEEFAPDMETGRTHNTEEYDHIVENIFQTPKTSPLSTFSIDVDNASYTNARRFINGGQMPYKDAVRIEEFINYFDYDYPQPKNDVPFSINTEVGPAPWNEKHKLVHIGLQGKDLDYENLSASNLVFLIDVSGSMEDANKLPLLRSSLKLLLDKLGDKDKVAIVVYAGAAGCVLPSTPATEKETIMKALDKLQAGGSTAGGAGIKLAYEIAEENLIENGNNRIILATDGDFNVGVSSTSEMVRMIEEKRKSGIYLTICGFGMGNYKDGRMEQISNAGNGNYFYIDNIKEAQKVFVHQMRATLFTIAKDVKIQVEFNPEKVQAYRLIGYENRMLKSEDFNDDKKDAGELGAGHTVTALYEIIPVGIESEFVKSVDELKYQTPQSGNKSNDLLTVKLRYKLPEEDKSKLVQEVLADKERALKNTSENFRFSASVAGFSLLLRDSEFKGTLNYAQVISLGKNAMGDDDEGYRREFIQLVESCNLMARGE